MAAGHKVTALADVRVPTGARVGYADPIVDRPASVTTTHFDTVGDLARCGNTIFEHCKPQLVADLYRAWTGTQGTTSFETVARYMVPGEMVGTYTPSTAITETLHARVWAKVGTGTGRLKLITNDDNGTQTFTNTGNAWVGSPNLHAAFSAQVATAHADQEVQLQAQHSSSNDQLTLTSAEVYWDTTRTTLPTGPYGVDVLPLYNANFETYQQPLSVAEMQKLVRMYDHLMRHRTPGMIVSSWFHGGADTGTHSNVVGRCLAFQGEYTSRVRFWVYMNAGTGGGATVTLNDGVVGLSGAVVRGLGHVGWAGPIDLDLPEVRGVLGGAVPRVWNVSVNVDSAATIYGVSGWFRPIETVTA